MIRQLLLSAAALLTGCMPASGPAPNAVFVVQTKSHPIDESLKALDSLSPLLDQKIDKHQDFAAIYSSALWYPHHGSETYGVAVVEWDQNIQGDGMGDMKGRYFIDVYQDDPACPLCARVKAALSQRNIRYFAACEDRESSTEYERIRCGT